jgi:hypothetical protein
LNKHPYIILAPPYRNSSAGVRALYSLGKSLEAKNYKVEIIGGFYQGWKVPSNAIVIYPETVSGNPMNGNTVVRWVLNTPSLLGGDKVYAKNELIFTWSENYYDAPVLTVPIIEDFFRNEHLPRSGACFWVGKGINVPHIPETECMCEITYEWPETREELALLLNGKEVFFTYDDNTALITEAKMCGCQVVVIPGEKESDYDDLIVNYENQLDEFIKITQAEAGEKFNVNFGVLVNDTLRLDMVLKRSQIQGSMNYVQNAESATKGLNILLDKAENEGADICCLVHQDVYLRSGWIDQVKSQIKLLPDSWVVAGVIGKDASGLICGKFHDMRIPDYFDTSDIHTFPHPACCFDEAVIIVNMKSGFRFDETLTGFDLYGTLCVLQTWEMGGQAFVIDAFCEHYCLRSFKWFPCETFRKNYKMLHDRFNEKWKVDSTALGLSPDAEEKLEQLKEFMTSAGPEVEVVV